MSRTCNRLIPGEMHFRLIGKVESPCILTYNEWSCPCLIYSSFIGPSGINRRNMRSRRRYRTSARIEDELRALQDDVFLETEAESVVGSISTTSACSEEVDNEWDGQCSGISFGSMIFDTSNSKTRFSENFQQRLSFDCSVFHKRSYILERLLVKVMDFCQFVDGNELLKAWIGGWALLKVIKIMAFV